MEYSKLYIHFSQRKEKYVDQNMYYLKTHLTSISEERFIIFTQ